MNWLDLFDDNFLDRSGEQAIRDFSGACEDDWEVVCPYIDILPEESGKEEGSPLSF